MYLFLKGNFSLQLSFMKRTFRKGEAEHQKEPTKLTAEPARWRYFYSFFFSKVYLKQTNLDTKNMMRIVVPFFVGTVFSNYCPNITSEHGEIGFSQNGRNKFAPISSPYDYGIRSRSYSCKSGLKVIPINIF
jgi:hypothetical protein